MQQRRPCIFRHYVCIALQGPRDARNRLESIIPLFCPCTCARNACANLNPVRPHVGRPVLCTFGAAGSGRCRRPHGGRFQRSVGTVSVHCATGARSGRALHCSRPTGSGRIMPPRHAMKMGFKGPFPSVALQRMLLSTIQMNCVRVCVRARACVCVAVSQKEQVCVTVCQKKRKTPLRCCTHHGLSPLRIHPRCSALSTLCTPSLSTNPPLHSQSRNS